VQTGISGRYIGETIRTMADLLCHAKVTSTPLGALLLDQEKALCFASFIPYRHSVS